MNKVSFLSSLFPKEQFNYIKENSIGAMGNANDSFQWALVKGFQENGFEVNLINVPNIGAYPKRFKKSIVKKQIFTTGNGKGISLGFLNLNIIKHYSAYLQLNKYLNSIEADTLQTLIVYDLYPPFLSVLKKLKKHHKDLKVIAVIPDIFGLTRDSTNIIHKFLDYFNIKSVKNNLKYVDGLVYLTESMKEQMPEHAAHKKFTVVEGILNPDNKFYEKQPTNNKFILYTGSLDVRHGILNLIDAFKDAGLSDIDLIICGDGEGKSIMLDKIKNENNVKYLGQLDRNEVVKMQSEAFLLINPRTSEGIFTKYSFPSKIIEYFASGTPTFMYRLSGIPQEYYNHCFSTSDESINALAKKLIEISLIPNDKMKEIGQEARSYVLENKNCKTQVSKIIKLVEEI